MTAKDKFSFYEVDAIGIKIKGESAFATEECLGSLKVERGTKTVTKKCKGVVVKKKTKMTGEGKLTISLHTSRELYRKVNGMTNTGLQPGVYAFDNTVLMPEMTIVAKCRDEDDNVIFLAYPQCSVEEASGTEIENGAEEVAELEMTLAYTPDDFHKGEYEALEDELTGDILNAENWMTSFSSALAQLTA